MSHLSWGGEQTTLCKGVSSRYILKLEGKPERESLEKTISGSGGFRQLRLF